MQVELEEVALNDASVECWEVDLEVVDTFAVEFYHLEVVTILKQELREHTHSGSHLKHRQVLVTIDSGSNALCHIEVDEEMLS